MTRPPTPRKRRVGLWVGLTVGGIVVAGAVAAGTLLVAPGTTIAGTPVGLMTTDAAADAVEAHVSKTDVTLTGAGAEGKKVLSDEALGLSVDVGSALESHRLWNVGAWGDDVPVKVTLDPKKSTEALKKVYPDTFTKPVDAGVVFDTAKGVFVTTPAKSGTGIDKDGLTGAVQEGLDKGDVSISYSGRQAPTSAAVTDAEAATTAATLNKMLTTIGFYIGKERTVPVAAATAATWLSVVPERGHPRIKADAQAIQKAVDALPATVNRAPVNAATIVDSAGKVLRTDKAGAAGRTLSDTAHLGERFAEQLAKGDGVLALPVTEAAATTVKVVRRIDINLSAQSITLLENDKAVQTWPISSGLPGTPTPTGKFKVFGHTASVNMGCFPGAPYCTKNVPSATWFAPNIAIHGAYWHNNFGHPMSHGCVNLPVDRAKFVYDWAPVGVEVSVHK